VAGRDYRVTVGAVPDLPIQGTAADGVAATDVASWQMDDVRTVTDPVGLTDSTSTVTTSARTAADALGITDSVSAVLNATTGWGASWGASWGR